MSDHNWVLENLESYSAGGLDAGERERLEAHLPACSSCSQALQDIRSADEHLESLFSPIRPQPGFEDRMITSLRNASAQNHFRLPLIGWVGMSAAAALLLGVTGAYVDKAVSGRAGSVSDRSGRLSISNNLKQLASALDSSKSMGENGEVTERAWAEAMPQDVDHDGRIDMWKSASGGKETAQSVDQLAQNMSEKHLTDLSTVNPLAISPDGGRIRFAQVTDGTSNTQMMGEKGVPEKISNATQPAATSAPTSEAKLPAMKETNAPAQQLGNEKKPDDGATLSGNKGPIGGGGGGRFGGGGFGGSGGAAGMQGMMGRIMGGPPGQPGGLGGQGQSGSNNFSFQPGFLSGFQPVPNPAFLGTNSATPAPALTEKPTFELYTQYFRPGEQSVADLQKAYKQAVETKEALDKAREVSKQVADAKPQAGVEIPKKTVSDALPDLGAIILNNKEKNQKTAEQEVEAASQKKGNQAAPTATPRKIIIRSGDMEFEVDSFDSAVATVTLLVNKLAGGFVDTVNSEKLPNGKVRGSVVVRVPPENLDTLVLELRKELGKTGELKGQKIGSQDITKQYTDMESRLKAARAMETRLLDIIKTGKGEIKDLLVAEKELGVWRTKIEEYEGEKRYFDNQVALSTLTISLAEKEIRSPAAVVETERIQIGVEVEDVVKAQQAALKAIDEVKGRVTKSELKQHAADQLAATINFEVAPDKAGTMRDRIEQLGRRTRLDIDRLQETEGGTGKPGEIKTRRKDSQFFLNLYNVANVAPRETVQLSMACVDLEDVYKKILARVEKATGRVVTSNLNRQPNDQTTGLIQFEVKAADADATLVEVRDLGEVMKLQVTENADVQNSTRSKRGFLVQLAAMGTVAARETDNIQLVTKDVPAGYQALQDAVAKAKGRVLNSQLNEQDKQNITAQLDFEIRRADEAALLAALKAAGDTYSQTKSRAPAADNMVDSKVRWQVSLINQARIPPRETVTLGIEVTDVDKTAVDFTKLATDSKGRTVESNVARERTGRTTAKLIFDVPLASVREVVNQFGTGGIVRVQQFSKNQQVPDSDLAIARIDVTLSNSPLIVPSDEGFGPEMRKGLATSVRVLSLSLSWLVFGLLVILPWVVVVYAIFRLATRFRRKPSPA